MEAFDLTMLGKRIRFRRKALKISQAVLAEKCGVSTAYVGHIERGNRSPSVEILLALCAALTVTPDYLLQDYLEDNPANHLTESDAKVLERIAQYIREPLSSWADKK